MKIAIVTPSLVDGDAVGNDVRGMYRCLVRLGLEAAIFSENDHTGMQASGIDQLDSRMGAGDLIIYHHSTSCEPAIRALERSPAAGIVKYHNITPGRYFAGYSDNASRGCDEGRDQLGRLARLDVPFLVDSPYNGEDLDALGLAPRWRVLPPFTQADSLLEAEPRFDPASDDRGHAPMVLVVGRVVPQKNVVAAVRGFARFAGRHPGPCRLTIVGNHTLRGYADEVRAEVAALGLETSVSLAGKVDLPRLKGYFARADALLLLSEHEGFGVPLVEAMALGVPAVVARAAALPDTGGDAVHYASGLGPDEVAAALGRVCDPGPYRDALVRRGRERYLAEFDNRVIAGRFLDLIGPFLRP